MDLVLEWLTGIGGLVAWIGIVLVIFGTGLLMRHLALTTRTIALRQVVWIVAASVGLLVVAGVGGFVLMHNA
jgi:membrane-bound ClpP family serine protease